MTEEYYEKKYKEALERARIWKNKSGMPKYRQGILDDIFPELKESEDEKIRKWLLDTITQIPNDSIEWDVIEKAKVLSWLEKQRSKDNDEDVDILHRFSFYSYKDEPNVLYLSGLYVNEECRNKGIGTKILEVADEVAKSLNCRAIRLKTKKDSDAERLYRIHGYNSLATEDKNEIWLEKQGEKKVPSIDFKAKDWYVSEVDGKIHDMTYNPTDKVEPKFKIGDYIVNDYCAGKVVALTDDAYLLDTEQGIPFSCEHNVHLWTIQDAKDGDVLATDNGVCIFNGTLEEGKYPLAYCGITARGFDFYNVDLPFSNDNNIHPATKEQHDLLFQKMREAGYQWDAKKKTLKKIEQKTADKVEPKFHEGEWIVWKNKCYKVNYNGCGYELIDQNGLSTWLEYGTVDENAHLWDITKDAKDGDVLISQYGNPLIYNGNYNSLNIGAYCGITCDDNKFKVAEEKCHWTENVDIKPATKEQRDTLMKAMADAGYTFDFDKKELKLLISNGGDFEFQ